MDIGSNRDARPGNRHHVAALATGVRGRGKSQMRRMLKEAVDAERGDGGLLSELHALAGSGIRNSAVISRTTRPLSTTVTCGTTFPETSWTLGVSVKLLSDPNGPRLPQ